jgi:hypothetical protein
MQYNASGSVMKHLESLFKPVEGGYVFRVPYQLGLGKVRHYLVSESQKAALAATIAGPRPVRTHIGLALAGAGAITVATLVVFALSRHHGPQASDTFAVIALSFALLHVEIAAWRFYKLRQLAPLLAQLPPTELAITRAEMRRVAIAGTATSHLQLNVILSSIVGGMNVALGIYAMAGGRSGSHLMVSGIVFIGIAVYYAMHLVSRLEKTRAM